MSNNEIPGDDSYQDYATVGDTVPRQLAQLAKALSLAQAQIKSAAKDSVNPHFKSKYADLASIWDACRGPLTSNGLCIVQIPTTNGKSVAVKTMILHQSGEFLEGTLSLTARDDTPQAVCSCITYARRYALAAFVGVAPDDDDGHEASKPNKPYQPPQNKPAPQKSDLVARLNAPPPVSLSQDVDQSFDYVIDFGTKLVGKKLSEIPPDQAEKIYTAIINLDDQALKEGKALPESEYNYLRKFEGYYKVGASK